MTIDDAHDSADVNRREGCRETKRRKGSAEGSEKLSKSDPLIDCTTKESGRHVMACRGELHARRVRSVELHHRRPCGVGPRDICWYVQPDVSHVSPSRPTSTSYLFRLEAVAPRDEHEKLTDLVGDCSALSAALM